MKHARYLIGMLAGLFCTVLCGCGSVSLFYENADRYSVGNAEITDPVENIELDWIAGAVRIEYHGEDSILLTETASDTLTKETTLHWYLDGTTLRIKFAGSGRLYLRNLHKDLTLTLPEGFSAGSIDISLASATLDAPELQAERVEVSTASGNVSLVASATEKIDISSASGRIELTQRGTCRKVDIESASGNITVTSDTVNDLDIHSASGKVILNAATIGSSALHTASGEIRLTLSGTMGDCDIETASGTVSLTLPEALGFTADVDTASGNFESEFSLKKSGNKYICGTGEVSIDIETASGDIYLQTLPSDS